MNKARPFELNEFDVNIDGNKLIINKKLSEERLFQGHFPHHKILPGIYLIEIVDQAISKYSFEFLQEKVINVENVLSTRFYSPLSKDDNVICSCEVEKTDNNKFIIKALVKSGLRKIATLKILYSRGASINV